MGTSFVHEIGAWVTAQLEACTRCGLCASACPFYTATGNPEYSPIWKLELLRRADQQQVSLLGRLKVALRLEKPVSEDDLQRWSEFNFGACSLCNRCSLTCPMGITVGTLLHELRDRLASTGTLPENLLRMEGSVQKDGNVFGYPDYERAGWVDYMIDAPDDLYQRGQAQVVYFVGCVSSFSPRAQRIAESFVKLLTAAQVDFTILGEGEVCCGFPLRAAGRRAMLDECIQRNVEAVRAAGAETVVFTCPACRLMWMEEYAAALPGISMLHAAELLDGLLAGGRLALEPLERSATYHDPCDLARTGGVYQAPRNVLNAIPGLELIEVHERRESGLCCGGGGDVEMVAPERVSQVSHISAGKLAAPGAQTLATACPQCMRVLEAAMKDVKPEMEVLDITEILARAAGLV